MFPFQRLLLQSGKETIKKLTELSAVKMRFLQFADVYVLRRVNVKANAYAELRENRLRSAGSNDSQLIPQ